MSEVCRIKRWFIRVLSLCFIVCFTGCGAADSSSKNETYSRLTENNINKNESITVADTEDGNLAGSAPDFENESEFVEEETTQNNTENQEEEQMLKIEVNDHTLYAKFEDNSSADALREKLEEGAITLDMHDYGNFEKVCSLPWSLPRNDTQITTKAGDVILYQGNQITIYYDINSWSFTRMAKIQDVSQDELKEILGDGNVTVMLSIE